MLHAVWRLGLVTAGRVHEELLDQGHAIARRQVHLLLQTLAEKEYLRAAKVGRLWTFVAVVDPEEAFEILWSEIRAVALNKDPEHKKAFLKLARKE